MKNREHAEAVALTKAITQSRVSWPQVYRCIHDAGKLRGDWVIQMMALGSLNFLRKAGVDEDGNHDPVLEARDGLSMALVSSLKVLSVSDLFALLRDISMEREDGRVAGVCQGAIDWLGGDR